MQSAGALLAASLVLFVVPSTAITLRGETGSLLEETGAHNGGIEEPGDNSSRRANASISPVDVIAQHIHPLPGSPIKRALRPTDRVCQVLPVIIVFLLGLSKMWQARAPQQRQTMTKAIEFLFVLALYLFSGPCVILVNKHIMRHYNFHFPIILASLGNVLIAFITRSLVKLKLVKLEEAPEQMSWRRYLRTVVPLNIFNFSAQVFGMWAYLFISVPCIQILKSITIVLTAFFAYLFVAEAMPPLKTVGILAISAGVCLSAFFEEKTATSPESKAPLIGICLSICASASESIKTVVCQILVDKFSLFDSLYWSSPMFVFIAIIFVCALELKPLTQQSIDPNLGWLLPANAVLTGMIVLATFWFTKLAGAISLKVVTQARSIGLILCSVFFFSETCNSMQYVGFSIALVGVWMFDISKNALDSTLAASKK